MGSGTDTNNHRRYNERDKSLDDRPEGHIWDAI